MPASFDRLLLAFANLESYGIATRIVPGMNPETERCQLQASIRAVYPAGTGSCVFLMNSDINCFDGAGDLRRPVPLHHSGPDTVRAAGAALADCGLDFAGEIGPNTIRVADLSPPGADPVGIQWDSKAPRLGR